MYCKHCGFQLEAGAAACPNCGTPSGMGSNFCGNCGTPKAGEESFCSGCGQSFSQTVQNNYGQFPTVQPYNAVQSNAQGFDFKAYFNEWLANVKGVLDIPDKTEMILRYTSYAASVLIFLFMMFPVISIHVEAIFYEYNRGSNLFAVSGFGAFMYIFALLASLATFLPHVQKFAENNKKLVPFMYLIVPLLELLGMLSMLIGVGTTNAAAKALLGDLINVRLGFMGWLILLITLAAVGAAVYHVIRYDLEYIKANNPFATTVQKPQDTITDAMNDRYQDTVYRGDDIKR